MFKPQVANVALNIVINTVSYGKKGKQVTLRMYKELVKFVGGHRKAFSHTTTSLLQILFSYLVKTTSEKHLTHLCH